MTEVERLAEEVREQNRLYEAGDVDKAFWLGQQNRLKAIREAEPGLGLRKIGALVGKGPSWVKDVLECPSGSTPVWTRGSHGTKAEIETGVQKALTDPVKRQQAVQKLPPEAKAKLVSELLDDEKVAADVAASPEGAKTADNLSAARWEHLGDQAREGRPKTGPSEQSLYSEARGAISDQFGKIHVASQRIEDYLHGALGYADRLKAEDWLRYEQACDSLARRFTQLASDANAMAKAKAWDGDPRDVA